MRGLFSVPLSPSAALKPSKSPVAGADDDERGSPAGPNSTAPGRQRPISEGLYAQRPFSEVLYAAAAQRSAGGYGRAPLQRASVR